mmetsp:Transcript_37017/g.115243  ORF Transcript_37017/g.115243 Transcript_37017/m.115243 type:complete len:320 (+) Transcript_37017:61-1020(+)
MHALAALAFGAILPWTLALRRPADVVEVGQQGQDPVDFQRLSSYFSEDDLWEILERLKQVPVRFKTSLMGVPMSSSKDLNRTAPRQCALVSNSRNLLEQNAGADIDAVDGPVLRINGAVTEGFEQHVGSRKELLMINDQMPCMWEALKQGPPRGVQFVIVNDFDNKDRRLRAGCVRYMVERFPQVKFFALDWSEMNQKLTQLLDDVVQKSPPSLWGAASDELSTSGLVGGLFLLNLCEEVRHFGFLHSEVCKEHYFDPDAYMADCTNAKKHSLSQEHILWKLVSSTWRSRHSGEGHIAGWPRLQSQHTGWSWAPLWPWR